MNESASGMILEFERADPRIVEKGIRLVMFCFREWKEFFGMDKKGKPTYFLKVFEDISQNGAIELPEEPPKLEEDLKPFPARNYQGSTPEIKEEPDESDTRKNCQWK